MKQVETEGEENLWVIETAIDGAKIILCVGVDETDAEDLLGSFASRLPTIWPSLHAIMQTAFEDYGHSEDFPPEEFFLGLSRTIPETYMSDKSTLMIRFEFEVEDFSDTIPIYDFFLQDDLKIVHHQPVF